MCRKLVVLALVLGLASVSYATQLANWDTGMDGWTDLPGWGGTATLTPGATVGVTQPTGSLKVNEGAGVTGWHWEVGTATWNAGVLFTASQFVSNNKLEFDVTRLVSDWTSSMQWSTVVEAIIQINYATAGTVQAQTENQANWDGTDTTAHVAIDYSGLVLPGDTVNWVQIALGMNSWGTGVPTNTILYYDNVKATPEPATMALLGLGGLALIRRKK